MNKNKILNVLFVFTILLAATGNTNSNNSPATLKQTEAPANMGRTAFPINDMYGVKKRVIQSQNQYQKAREAQAKQMQELKNKY